MFSTIIFAFFWMSFAAALAFVEIESEGKYGWAEKTPTWYRTTGFWGKVGKIFMNGKPITGYHLFMFLVPLLTLHAKFFEGVAWSLPEELTTIARLFAVWVMWDWYWFLLNPEYAGRFRRENVWWHSHKPWVFGLFPVDYLNGMVFSLVAAAATIPLVGVEMFFQHVLFFGWVAVYSLTLYIFAPYYHRWYRRMRLTDDRDKAGIPPKI